MREQGAYNDIEKKRMQYINKLSLAERLGLVDKPPQPLSQAEWMQIELNFLKRTKNAEPCPICFENLQFDEQSILSCTHVYHKTCIESFERFQRGKGQTEKYCPICRRANYDSKPFIEGQKRYLVAMVVKLQGLTRGFLARNAFYHGIIDKNYTPECEDMRKRLIGFKLSLISKRRSNMIQK